MDVRIGVQLMHFIDEISLGYSLRHLDMKWFNPNFCASLSFHTHIGLRIFAAPYYDNSQTRNLELLTTEHPRQYSVAAKFKELDSDYSTGHSDKTAAERSSKWKRSSSFVSKPNNCIYQPRHTAKNPIKRNTQSAESHLATLAHEMANFVRNLRPDGLGNYLTIDNSRLAIGWRCHSRQWIWSKLRFSPIDVSNSSDWAYPLPQAPSMRSRFNFLHK